MASDGAADPPVGPSTVRDKWIRRLAVGGYVLALTTVVVLIICGE